MFPVAKIRRTVKSEDDISVYWMPELLLMVECNQWYHVAHVYQLKQLKIQVYPGNVDPCIDT